MEDEALKTIYILLSSGVAVSIIAFILSALIFCKLVNSSMHPFKSILITTEDEMKKALKSLTYHATITILSNMPDAVIEMPKEELMQVRTPTPIVHSHHQDVSEESASQLLALKPISDKELVVSAQVHHDDLQHKTEDQQDEGETITEQTGLLTKELMEAETADAEQAQVTRSTNLNKRDQKGVANLACETPVTQHDDKPSEDEVNVVNKSQSQDIPPNDPPPPNTLQNDQQSL